MATKRGMNVDLNSVFEGAASQFRNLNPNEPGRWPMLPKLMTFRWPGAGHGGARLVPAAVRRTRRLEGSAARSGAQDGLPRQAGAGRQPGRDCASRSCRSGIRDAAFESSSRARPRWTRCSRTSTRPASGAACSSSCSVRAVVSEGTTTPVAHLDPAADGSLPRHRLVRGRHRNLSRIVTLHNLATSCRRQGQGDGVLGHGGHGATYRYLDRPGGQQRKAKATAKGKTAKREPKMSLHEPNKRLVRWRRWQRRHCWPACGAEQEELTQWMEQQRREVTERDAADAAEEVHAAGLRAEWPWNLQRQKLTVALKQEARQPNRCWRRRSTAAGAAGGLPLDSMRMVGSVRQGRPPGLRCCASTTCCTRSRPATTSGRTTERSPGSRRRSCHFARSSRTQRASGSSAPAPSEGTTPGVGAMKHNQENRIARACGAFAHWHSCWGSARRWRAGPRTPSSRSTAAGTSGWSASN